MKEDDFTSFQCDHCHTEIEASPDLIGQETECPACGTRLTVPDNRNDGVVRHGVNDLDKSSTQAIKSRTIRIELGDL